VNDFDLYFTNKETVKAVAEYYVKKLFTLDKFIDKDIEVKDDGERIRIVVKSSGIAGDIEGDEDKDKDLKPIKTTAEDKEDKKFFPVCVSSNAITLSNKFQIVIRFFGDHIDIHENFDFIHCTNYWRSDTGEIILNAKALESLITRELRYRGSKYPLASIIRIRKFIRRGWWINAGQILKMAWQLQQIDLTDIATLEDQLMGVDSAYFYRLIALLKVEDLSKIDSAYLCKLIDKIF